jgi:hypothetical protein
MAFTLFHLGDILNEIGEDKCLEIFSNFLCPLDDDVEYFLKEKAILFQKMNIARTYLVYTTYKDKPVLVGYFAIALKPLQVRRNVSGTLKKKLTGTKSKTINTIQAILIGQLAKNYHNKYNELITGSELLYLVFKVILDIHHLIGGRVIFLECKNAPGLVEFYTKNGFSYYDTESENNLLQYICFVNDIELK